MHTPEEIKAAGLDDFRVFLRQVWDHLDLPPPTAVQNDLARELQHGDRRLIIQAFRGVGKSWITVAYVLWTLLLDPQKKIMVVSASQNLADDFSKFCKQLIHGMPLLQHLTPRRGQKDSGIAFDVGPARSSKDPSVKSVGITGQLTGSRADLIVPDDIEVPKNSYTHLLRERLADLVKEFDAVLKPGGMIRYLGTPQVEMSLYPRLARERGYTIKVWPAEIPKNPEAYHGNLADFTYRLIEKGVAAGTPVEPTRFPQQELDERRASYGLSGYALQFMLDTNPSSTDKHPLRLRDLILHDCDSEMGHVKLVWGASRDLTIQDLPAGGLDGDVYNRPAWKSDEMAKYSGTVLAIDPSGKGKDETAYAIVRFLHGFLYLVDVGGFVDGFGEETLQTIARRAARFKVNKVIAEDNFGGGMFRQLLKPHLAKLSAGTFDEDWNGWSTGNKEARILDVMEPLTHNHRLVVDRGVIERDLKTLEEGSKFSFVRQYTRMERTKGALPNEDRLEAVSMACSYWVEKMARDTDKTLKSHQDEILDEELRRFKENATFLNRQAPARSGRFGGLIRA